MMNSVFPRPTDLAHEWVSQVLCPGDLAVDATLGNGHDALFMARCVGVTGKVYGFDVQEDALLSAAGLMREAGIHESAYEWHLCSHALMGDKIPSPVKVVMFNLGYLPGADHGIITTERETIAALQVAESLVMTGGMITVLCYPGHAGGEEEMLGVREWACARGEEWHVVHYEKWATRRKAPVLVAMQKKEVLRDCG
jgi:hypothetical protein